MIGQGSIQDFLGDDTVRDILDRALSPIAVEGKRVLAIIPDSTRTAPIPLLFEVLYDLLGRRVARLDYLIALGTHPPMSEVAIDHLVGVTAAERTVLYPNVAIFNHEWDSPTVLTTIGTISAADTATLTDGLFVADVPVVLNRMVTEYDFVLLCGPVFPHEVAGFSGGAKYLFPGVAGADIIHFTHWLGALATSMETIGVKETAVRRVIHRAADFVTTPVLCIAMVLQGATLHGLYVGDYREAWDAAADLSALLNIRTMERPFRKVLSMPALLYDDLWTAAKAMYKTEPVIADGGEVIIYAPHITEISYTHAAVIDEVGYHVRDYFLKQWERFRHLPGGILAHSTHVKGAGTYDAETGRESPRIHVTLATRIPEERCRRVNLGYVDYHTIDPADWQGREAEGILCVPHAGETLYRLG